MKQKNIYSFYFFGYNYCLFSEFGLKGISKEDAIRNLDIFLKKIEELDLLVTHKACTNLIKVRDEISDSTEKEISKLTAEKLKKKLKKLDIVIDSELKLKKAFILTEKRYSLDKLMNNPYQLLAKNVFNHLAENAKKDFSSGCYQVALNQATGSAFHLMRALEEQVKQMYFHFKKTKRLAKPMWGPMLTQLESKNKPKPSRKLIDYLNSIRIHYRNPTQHPELFYTMDEAQDLLNQTISALNMIDSEIKN